LRGLDRCLREFRQRSRNQRQASRGLLEAFVAESVQVVGDQGDPEVVLQELLLFLEAQGLSLPANHSDPADSDDPVDPEGDGDQGPLDRADGNGDARACPQCRSHDSLSRRDHVIACRRCPLVPNTAADRVPLGALLASTGAFGRQHRHGRADDAHVSFVVLAASVLLGQCGLCASVAVLV
jgi:hypothetical protein